nr:molybdopterin-binding protein [uncultured Mailhella sp.]
MSRISMTTIPVTQAVGTVLCHDITRIEPGVQKGPVFRKGHIVREEDIPVLLSVGKENLYVYAPAPGEVHENDAATRIGNAVAGQNIVFSDIKEGRINFLAAEHGLLRVDVPALAKVNAFPEIVLATLHTMQEVKKGQAVGGTRIIPLLIEEEKIAALEQAVTAPVIEVLPFRSFRVGMVTTGNEVYSGRIKDAFGPVLRQKFESLGSSILGQSFSDDSIEMTVQGIRDFIEKGADMVVCTGGMSVDPDDRTPAAIRAAGGRVVTYGAPTFPGAMFLLAYIDNIPVLGLPGCVMYHRASIFDLVVPRLLAGVPVTREDIVALGHGGYCAGCGDCRYPNCAFGKN